MRKVTCFFIDNYFAEKESTTTTKNGESGITPSYFPALMNMAIFHNSEPMDRTDCNHAFYFEGFIM